MRLAAALLVLEIVSIPATASAAWRSLTMAAVGSATPASAFASATPTKRKRALSSAAMGMESSATTPTNIYSGGKKAKAKIAVRTSSFDAVVDPSVAPRVLILGSHPSSKSLEKVQYYGRRTNAFWWLVADALGFAFDPKDEKHTPGNIKVRQSPRTGHTRTASCAAPCGPRLRHLATTTTTTRRSSTRSMTGERRRSNTMTTTRRCEC